MLGAGVPPVRHHDPGYLDSQERPDHQTDACDTHASELSAELRVIRPHAPRRWQILTVYLMN
jgi:hypothetical protein